MAKGDKQDAAALQMQIGEVALRGYRCRCGHEWLSRTGRKPKVCPKCKSVNWDEPKKFERKR